jgi:hypothetical protein
MSVFDEIDNLVERSRTTITQTTRRKKLNYTLKD